MGSVTGEGRKIPDSTTAWHTCYFCGWRLVQWWVGGQEHLYCPNIACGGGSTEGRRPTTKPQEEDDGV